jgi:hypothetical protein
MLNCPKCCSVAKFIRERPFADGSGRVYTCTNDQCANYNLYFYAPIDMKKNLKVCPGCGSMPWDFANPGPEPFRENQPQFCQDCGERLVARSELPRDIWKDPCVKEALKAGRQAWDIACLRCPECDQLGYYNEGQSFSCRFCDLTFLVVGVDGVPARKGCVSADDIIRLDDTVTETTDGYHNETH